MKVSWSHCVLKVRDVEAMAQFYCDAFGWEIADRGGIGEEQEIVFLTGSSSDHHQMALTNTRKDGDGGSLDHNAFRVESVADVKDVLDRMSADERVRYAVPVTHGNAVSVYFADPEGNGIEVFCDTPWHVRQPIVGKWDPAESDQAILERIRAEYAPADEFMPMGDYRAERAAHFGEVQ